jgi:hypothetical protein
LKPKLVYGYGATNIIIEGGIGDPVFNGMISLKAELDVQLEVHSYEEEKRE